MGLSAFTLTDNETTFWTETYNFRFI